MTICVSKASGSHFPAISRPVTDVEGIAGGDRQTYWLPPLGLAGKAGNGICSERMHTADACALSIASPAGNTPRGRHHGQGGKEGEGYIGRRSRIYVTVDDGC